MTRYYRQILEKFGRHKARGRADPAIDLQRGARYDLRHLSDHMKADIGLADGNVRERIRF